MTGPGGSPGRGTVHGCRMRLRRRGGRDAGRGGGRDGHGLLLGVGSLGRRDSVGRHGLGVARQDRSDAGAGTAPGSVAARLSTAVQLAHPAGDREADARATAGVVAGAKAVEDAAGVLGRDAGALVGHLQPPPVSPVGAGGDADGAAGRTVAAGVVEQVGEDLLETCDVRGDGESLLDRDGRAAPGGRWPALPRMPPRPPGSRGRRRRPPTRASGATPPSTRLRSSRSPTSEPSRSAWARAVRSTASSGVTTPSTRFSSRACCAAKGVRSSCETVATSWRRCRSASERSAAIVLKAIRQLAHLVGGGRGDAARVVAGRHVRRGLRHLAQGGGHAAGEPLGRAQGDRDGDGHAEPGGHAGAVADLRHEGRDDDADGDEQAELDLDRADAVEGAVGVHCPARPTSLAGGLERVADAVHGAHPLGSDLRPECLDVAVEGAGAAGIGPAPHLLHEVVAAAHGPRLESEGQEQVELQRRQVHLGPGDDDAPRRAVDDEVAQAEQGCFAGDQLAGPLHPAQQGPDRGPPPRASGTAW